MMQQVGGTPFSKLIPQAETHLLQQTPLWHVRQNQSTDVSGCMHTPVIAENIFVLRPTHKLGFGQCVVVVGDLLHYYHRCC